MNYKEWINSIITRFDWLDLMLIELSNIAFGLLLAKLFPALTAIGAGWLVLAVVLLGLRPLLKVW
ncbi:MAG: hypothetical protein R6X02_27410 [Enhygromyxa sp.]